MGWTRPANFLPEEGHQIDADPVSLRSYRACRFRALQIQIFIDVFCGIEAE